jgi:hypothetical protein
VGGAERAAARVKHLDGPGLGAIAVGDIAGEDPRVTGGYAQGGLTVDTDFSHCELKQAD